MSSAAKPLNVSHLTNGKPTSSNSSTTLSRQAAQRTPVASSSLPKPEDISSPHELTMFVETLLTQLESKFDEMSSQVLDKMTTMSTRVDALEVAIQDLINDTAVSSSTAPTPTTLSRIDSTRSVEPSD